MASDSRAEADEAAHSARKLGAALDAIEAALAKLELGAAPDVVVRGLSEPIRAFDAAAKEAAR